MTDPGGRPPTLHDRGWHQGRLARVTLDLVTVDLDEAGTPVATGTPHELWVVATQDCDLARLPLDDAASVVELRPVDEADRPPPWGIRARRLRLTDTLYTDADRPRVHVSARVLHRRAEPLPAPADAVLVAFKTWLGRRYDRPAVPEAVAPLMTALAEAIEQAAKADADGFAADTRDVLVQVDEATAPPRYGLYAVVTDDADRAAVRRRLTDIATRVPVELGIPDRIEVATAAEVSLELIETSYAADTARITWRGRHPDPRGAH